ncbi:KTSC domain-containing protein [Variovorax sp. Varisp41]|uniref:KTSC domain-containing protein n=1 Tax=Variovorax sp. Varisp41 TaxID=3243033 RepID=UPI0039B6BAF8
MPKTFPTPAAFSKKPFIDIPMTAVESHQDAAVGYDAERRMLQVTFTRGSNVYQYPDVAPEVHAAFMAAESKGKYFGEHIKPLDFDKFPGPVTA